MKFLDDSESFCNGYEMASGAIRNHKAEIMLKAFEIAGYPDTAVEEQFGVTLTREPTAV